MAIDKINIIHVSGFETDNPFLPLVGGNIATSPTPSAPPPTSPTPTSPTPTSPTPTSPTPTSPTPTPGGGGSSSALIKVDFGRNAQGDSTWNKVRGDTNNNWNDGGNTGFADLQSYELKDATGADSGVTISGGGFYNTKSDSGNGSSSGEDAKYIFLATDGSGAKTFKGTVKFTGLVANGNYTVVVRAYRDNTTNDRSATYSVTGGGSKTINGNSSATAQTFNAKATAGGEITLTVDLGMKNGAFAYLNWVTLAKA